MSPADSKANNTDMGRGRCGSRLTKLTAQSNGGSNSVTSVTCIQRVKCRTSFTVYFHLGYVNVFFLCLGTLFSMLLLRIKPNCMQPTRSPCSARQPSSQKEGYSRSLMLINVIGFMLSGYAYHVSVSKKAEASYTALCDISESMSCSRVLTSPYSTGFGFMGKLVGESSILNQSNSVVGMFHYSLLFILSFSKGKFLTNLHLILAVLSNIGSIYLSVILAILRDFCLVCVLTYIVNLINLFLVYKKLQIGKMDSQKKKE